MNDLETRLENVKPSKVRVAGRAISKVARGVGKTLVSYLPNEIYSKVVSEENEQGRYITLSCIAQHLVTYSLTIYHTYDLDPNDAKIFFFALPNIFDTLFSLARVVNYRVQENNKQELGKDTGNIVLCTLYNQVYKPVKSFLEKTALEVKEDRVQEIIYEDKVERVGGSLTNCKDRAEGRLELADDKSGGMSVRGVDYE
jgi:hypothetical protein